MSNFSMRQIRAVMALIFCGAFASMIFLTGCPASVNNPDTLSAPSGQTVIVPAEEFDDWPQDPLSINEISIDANNLAVDLSYSGGCAEHSYALVVGEDVAESLPPQMTAILSHDDPGDPCDAIIGEIANFDLVPIRNYLQTSSGGGPGSVILTIRLGDQSYKIQYDY